MRFSPLAKASPFSICSLPLSRPQIRESTLRTAQVSASPLRSIDDTSKRKSPNSVLQSVDSKVETIQHKCSAASMARDDPLLMEGGWRYRKKELGGRGNDIQTICTCRVKEEGGRRWRRGMSAPLPAYKKTFPPPSSSSPQLSQAAICSSGTLR